jgi:hypothetical protein
MSRHRGSARSDLPGSVCLYAAAQASNDLPKSVGNPSSPSPLPESIRKRRATNVNLGGGDGAVSDSSPPSYVATCAWCSGPFASRRSGGRPQRFCSPAHRRAWDTAARRLVARMVAESQLAVGVWHDDGRGATRAPVGNPMALRELLDLPGPVVRRGACRRSR